MVDYSAVADGERKLQNAVYQFVLGIRGRRTEGVTRSQIMKWFHGTPESFVGAAVTAILNDKIIYENGKFHVMTVRDHALKANTALAHWRVQAELAMGQGKTMGEFLASVDPVHRLLARKGYQLAKEGR